MKKNAYITASWLTTGVALILLNTTAFAADPAVAASSTASKPAAASNGLLNDWLDKQYPALQPWDFGGQVRFRYEVFDNASPAYPNRDFQRNGAANDNRYLWTRERIHLGYNTPWLSVYGEGQNSDSTGDHDTRNPGRDPFDLYQAFVILGNAKEFPLTAKVGRQELIYGDERLIGASDWSNTGRSFDAAKLRYENKSFWVDAFVSRVVLIDPNEYDESDHHDWFSGVYASSTKLIPVQESQFYVLSRNSGAGAAVSPRDIYSIGGRVKSLPGKLKGWDYFGEIVGQFGSVSQSGVRRTQQAFAVAARGGYTWQKVVASPRLGIEYDYATGDSDPKDGKSDTLDNLFPTNHKHYGLMDVMGWRNIHDLRFSLGLKPCKKLSVSLDQHLFWLANTHDYFYPQSGSGRTGNGYGLNASYDSYVGSEFDLEANYALTAWPNFRAGYGHFWTGGYVDSSKSGVGGATGSDWIYVQALVKF
jgi:hypothetical protein